MPSMPTSALGLSPRYRRHALDRLERMIAAAESERSRQHEAIARLTRAKKRAAHAKARLRVAEYRLALLRSSRRWLTVGSPPIA